MGKVIQLSDYRVSEVKSERENNVKPKFNPINNTEIPVKRVYSEEDYAKAIEVQRVLAFNIVKLLKLDTNGNTDEMIAAVIQKAKGEWYGREYFS